MTQTNLSTNRNQLTGVEYGLVVARGGGWRRWVGLGLVDAS